MLMLCSDTETVAVTGLKPFTEYKFSVFSFADTAPLYNVTSCRTLESCKSCTFSLLTFHRALSIPCSLGFSKVLEKKLPFSRPWKVLENQTSFVI